MAKRWKYQGDVNLCCGGVFARNDDDNMEYIEIIPAYDMGGPDNVFLIHIYFSNDPIALKDAFDSEVKKDFISDHIVMIGQPDYKHDSGWKDDWKNMFPNMSIYRSDAKLKNIIKRDFMNQIWC